MAGTLWVTLVGELLPTSILLQVEEAQGSMGMASPPSSSSISAAPHLPARDGDGNLLARVLGHTDTTGTTDTTSRLELGLGGFSHENDTQNDCRDGVKPDQIYVCRESGCSFR